MLPAASQTTTQQLPLGGYILCLHSPQTSKDDFSHLLLPPISSFSKTKVSVLLKKREGGKAYVQLNSGLR